MSSRKERRLALERAQRENIAYVAALRKNREEYARLQAENDKEQSQVRS